MTGKPALGFIGAGKVGIPLARLGYANDYAVRAVYSRTGAHARELAGQVGATAEATVDAVIDAADLTLFTVPDDAIESAAGQVTRADLRGKAIIHTSGARDAAALAVLAARGAIVGSLHPIFPFADADTAATNLPGAVFALEAEDAVLRGWLVGLVEALRGHVLAVPPGQKALYHSALVFASNYTVTLYAIAERLLLGLGAEKGVANEALNGLLHGTAENVQQRGIPDALTGPLVRGDSGTIAAHLAALEETPFADLYRQLARQSYPMLEARQVDSDPIERIIRQSENHAIDNP
jgi:predicted short-subunit dehydrogenase-like oxidoreductase (DUF2520 family)